MNEDLRQLRKKMDGDEGFLTGHQILKIRKREKIIPEWAMNDQLLRGLLSTVFPKWRTSQRQLRQAARWVWAIHLYYRLGMPHNQVAEEMSLGYGALRSLLRSIRRASKGLKANGRGPKTGKPVGRPKKVKK
jgi:hypothetical protein